MGKLLIDQDTRFWEVYDAEGKCLGLFMYYDLMLQFNAGRTCLAYALNWLKSIDHTWKVVGDICPLEEDSDNPIIQKKKVEYRKREKNRDKKIAKKKGFKLDSTIRFGKHSGTKIKDLIDKHPSYWNWILANSVLLLHPETKLYSDSKNTCKV